MHADILVTGNDNFSRISLADGLHRSGYDVVEAHTLHDAEAMLHAGLSPRILILSLKGMSAEAKPIIDFIRYHQSGTNTRIILIGSKTECPDECANVDVYFSRPIELANLFASDALTA